MQPESTSRTAAAAQTARSGLRRDDRALRPGREGFFRIDDGLDIVVSRGERGFAIGSPLSTTGKDDCALACATIHRGRAYET
ncbi:hypothetical protein GCM10009823_21090 [Brevibacterium salitolerans]|uniref:Uncharacterized protein n=1 Tax=Brevibacterium salitolerans TaxID=1403566 RepID=A0ABN2WUW5_9MICO